MIRKIVLYLFISMSLPTAVMADPSTSGGQEATPMIEFSGADIGFLRLSLQDCIAAALKNNFDVEIARLNPRMEEKDISVEKARFDPILKASEEIREDQTPINNFFVSGIFAPTEFFEDIRTFNTTLSILTPIGATASIEYDFNRRFAKPVGARVLIFNPAMNSFIEAKLTLPLLKKAGIFYNRSLIYIARNEKKVSLQAFKRTLIEVTNAVQRAYWDLVKAVEDLKVAHKSLQMAEEFLQKNKHQVEAGLMAPIEIVVAEEEVAARQEAIITTENAVKDREDELKRLMNFIRPGGDPILADMTIVPMDKPVFEVKKPSVVDSLKTALENRPELFENKLTMENADIRLKRRKNELLPQLDIEGGIRYSGLGPAWHNATEAILTNAFQGEFVKFSLEVPIGLRAERANLARARLERRQAELNISKTEQDILVQVRAAVRKVHTDTERIKATQKTRQLAQERLDAEEKKFAVGRSTNLEVLRAQESLSTAEGNENKAITDYQISQGQLEAVMGTILERYGMIMEES